MEKIVKSHSANRRIDKSDFSVDKADFPLEKSNLRNKQTSSYEKKDDESVKKKMVQDNNLNISSVKNCDKFSWKK